MSLLGQNMSSPPSISREVRHMTCSKIFLDNYVECESILGQNLSEIGSNRQA